jgi:hypothetical protein
MVVRSLVFWLSDTVATWIMPTFYLLPNARFINKHLIEKAVLVYPFFIICRLVYLRCAILLLTVIRNVFSITDVLNFDGNSCFNFCVCVTLF